MSLSTERILRARLATVLIETEAEINEPELILRKKHGGDDERWPLTPLPFLEPWPYHPPAIEMPPRPVPAGPLIS